MDEVFTEIPGFNDETREKLFGLFDSFTGISKV